MDGECHLCARTWAGPEKGDSGFKIYHDQQENLCRSNRADTHIVIKQDWIFQNQIQRASHESQGHESLFYALW